MKKSRCCCVRAAVPAGAGVLDRSGVVTGPREGCTDTARKRRSRRLLDTTNTDENAIAAPAISGFSRPAMASGSAATL